MNEDRTDIHPAPPIHYEHWCEHPDCPKWGSFGFERDKSETNWFCLEHRPKEYRGQRLEDGRYV